MRQIFVVNATQVVVSEDNPQGVFSTLPNFPKTFDSRTYGATEANPDGDVDKAARMARAEFFGQQSALLKSDTRAMWTVTLERADGKQILPPATWGSFPDMTPEPQPVEPVEGE
jgi:hypothetical protein